MNELDIAWLAGYLEGEGCFCTGSRSERRGRRYGTPSIRLQATDRDVVERAARLMGCECRPVAQRIAGRRPIFAAGISGARAIEAMRLLAPHMGARRTAKIAEVLSEAESRSGVAFGSKCGQAKLTEDDVREIRRLNAIAGGKHGTQSELARRFGVSQTSIFYIVQGKTWRHVAA